MKDEERVELAKKLDEDLENYVSNLKRKKYEDGWKEDKWEEEMEQHPMFMSKPLVEEQEMPPLVEAFQQLKYDPDFNSAKELALSYKEDGNQHFKRKKYRWAAEAYTKAIDAKCEDPDLNAVLYTNRAAALFYLGSFRKALNDVSEAKTLNPNHLKSFQRGALCCFELRKYGDCINWCDEGLKLNSEDKTLKDLRNKALEQKEKTELLEKQAAEKILREKLELQTINKILKKRGIKCEGNELTIKSLEPILPEAVGSKVHTSNEDTLIWPVLFLYPEVGQSDFIRGFSEKDNFYDQFDMMFREPPGWDINQKYKPESVQVYFSDVESKLIPIDKMNTLSTVLSHKRFILRSGTLSFFVTIADSDFDKSFQKNSLYRIFHPAPI